MTFADRVRVMCDALSSDPADRTTRRVLADLFDENDMPRAADMLRRGLCFGGYSDNDGYGDGGYGDGDGGYGDGGYGDGGYGDGGYGDGYGDGGYGDGGNGYGDGHFKIRFAEGFGMVDGGLYIVCSPGGYYPYVRIGWCRRNDDFVEMWNCRVIKRFGTDAELSVIAREGPKPNTKLLTAAKMEDVCVAMISRRIRCDPAAWANEVPYPKELE